MERRMGMGVSFEKIDQILRCQIIHRFERYSFNFLIDKIINGFPTQALNYGPAWDFIAAIGYSASSSIL